MLTPGSERSTLKADTDLCSVVQGILIGTHRCEGSLLPARDQFGSLQREAGVVTTHWDKNPHSLSQLHSAEISYVLRYGCQGSKHLPLSEFLPPVTWASWECQRTVASGDIPFPAWLREGLCFDLTS